MEDLVKNRLKVLDVILQHVWVGEYNLPSNNRLQYYLNNYEHNQWERYANPPTKWWHLGQWRDAFLQDKQILSLPLESHLPLRKGPVIINGEGGAEDIEGAIYKYLSFKGGQTKNW